MFRLALALGFPHPDYLLPMLNSRQITEWQAYWEMEPFGEIAAEFRSGQIAAMIVNTHLRKGSQPMKAADFVPTSYGLTNGDSRPQTLEEQKAIVQSFVAQAKRTGKVTERKRRRGR
jgi:hypothetical protein